LVKEKKKRKQKKRKNNLLAPSLSARQGVEGGAREKQAEIGSFNHL